MKRLEKLGYMALGAGILALGIIIGQFITPPIEAQNNGVFDKITCREIEVVDSEGKMALRAYAGEKSNEVTIYDKEGYRTIELSTVLLSSGVYRNSVSVNNKKRAGGIELSVSEIGNGVIVWGKTGKPAIGLSAEENSHVVTVFDEAGEQAINLDAYYIASVIVRNRGDQKGGIGLLADQVMGGRILGWNEAGKPTVKLSTAEHGGVVGVYGKGGKAVEMEVTEHGGRIDVFNNQGENRAVMSVNEYGNGAVSTWDKQGYRQ